MFKVNNRELKYRMNVNIEKHGKVLNDIFKTDFDNVTLCKKLFRLENKANRVATDECNGLEVNENWDDIILDKVDKILKFKEKNIPVFINGDPRGYAIKIHNDFVRLNNIKIFTDLGGYGIIAPDFREIDYIVY